MSAPSASRSHPPSEPAPPRSPLSWPLYGLLAGVLLGFSAWFGVSARSWSVPRERIWIHVVVAVTALVVAVELGRLGLRAARSLSAHGASRALRPSPAARSLLLDLAAVTIWSFALRFGLTTLSLLTDGGSGYGRFFGRVPGFQGLAVVSRLLFDLEDPAQAMHRAMLMTATLSALAPGAALLLARSLGMGRRVALLTGVAIASIPAHAVLFTSDFLSSPLCTLGILALVAVAWATRHGGELLAAGLALLSFVVWGRPEAAVIVFPLFFVGWPLLARARHQRWMLLPMLWFAVNVGAAALRSMNGERIPVAPSMGFESLRRTAAILWSQPAPVPLWMWVGGALFVLLAVFGANRRRIPMLVVCAATGAVPSLTSWAVGDPSGGHTELYRYGVWALPWIAMALAAGWDTLLTLLVKPVPSPSARRAASGLATGAVVAWMLSSPLLHLDYLGRVFSHDAELPVFLELRAQVPRGCGLFVMEDDSHHSVAERFQWASGNPMETFGRVPIDAPAVDATTDFFRRLEEAGGALPSAQHLTREGETHCWYYYRAPRCDHGASGQPEPICAEVEQRLELELVAERFFDFVHPRLSTLIDLPDDNPFRDPAARAALYRVVGARPEAPAPPSAD